MTEVMDVKVDKTSVVLWRIHPTFSFLFQTVRWDSFMNALAWKENVTYSVFSEDTACRHLSQPEPFQPSDPSAFTLLLVNLS